MTIIHYADRNKIVFSFSSGISACDVEGEDDCKCEKYFDGIPGQSCSEGRHNCDDSRTCHKYYPWHACCLDEEEPTETEEPTEPETKEPIEPETEEPIERTCYYKIESFA